MSEPIMNFPGPSGAALDAMRNRLQRKRKAINAIALTASLAAMAFGLLWLVWILYTTVHLGVGGLSLQLFTESTPAPNTEGGGLANAVVGSLLLCGFGTLVGRPEEPAGEHDPLHQRHPAVRAVDRDRPVRVRDRRCEVGALLGLGRRDRTRAAADSDRDPHDREHAEARAERTA
jgi:hypothetical protein